jgi:hypothetical protein
VPSLTLEEEMRLLLAMFKHETNTFSPVPTPFERFFDFGEAVGGEEAISMYRGTGAASAASSMSRSAPARNSWCRSLPKRRPAAAWTTTRTAGSPPPSSTKSAAAATTASCSTCMARW